MNTDHPSHIREIDPNASASSLPHVLLTLAGQLEADEHRIKEFLLRAAGRGDVGAVIATLKRWLSVPPSEVLASGEPAPVDSQD